MDSYRLIDQETGNVVYELLVANDACDHQSVLDRYRADVSRQKGLNYMNLYWEKQ